MKFLANISVRLKMLIPIAVLTLSEKANRFSKL